MKLLPFLALACVSLATAKQPNILFLFSDDHALRSISAYGGDLAKVAPTPNIDRLAASGAIFENSFCGNSICGPSRATIMTGKHSHKNGFLRNSGKGLDQSQWTLSKALHGAGYNTAVIGKWHLVSDPVGFDYWEILPGQGNYYNPVFKQMDGTTKKFNGYCTDITTEKAIKWLDKRDKQKPFFLMCQHKAPHRTFAPALRHLKAFEGVTIPEPPTLFDDYKNRSGTLAKNEMEIDRHFDWAYDAKVRKDERNGVELPGLDRYPTVEYRRMTGPQKERWDAHFGPENRTFIEKVPTMSHRDIVRWKYQRYMKNYLATVKAVDESVGRMLDYLDKNGLAENTIVVYASDQGFYLGEHGWYDKRWMFEESFKMPFAIRWPGVTRPGSRPKEMIQNIDYAPTFLEAAGIEIPAEIQGKSIVPVLKGESKEWRKSLYYSYYEKGEHNVPQHFGVRTETHKLFYLPGTDEWQLFDLVKDPQELTSVHDIPAYAKVKEKLTQEFNRLREHYEAPAFK
ncbi:sulfatase [Akkermansiaceae bacterium]|nr:sulfatase [Akkermansiaceae bacterium]MDB4370233.1 sulfatase [Akkermansiaceae bacterium]MDB4572634.1 sulfatase [Akkermansiaceae bacterium]